MHRGVARPMLLGRSGGLLRLLFFSVLMLVIHESHCDLGKTPRCWHSSLYGVTDVYSKEVCATVQ
jgi:hypothetical protein